jgi:hypothetical protein
MAKRKRTNNDLENTEQKIKDWATQLPPITSRIKYGRDSHQILS